MTKPGQSCAHDQVCLKLSPYAAATSYKRPSSLQRVKATTSSNKTPPCPEEASFPAPLVLPGDDLALEEEQAQSLRSWLIEPHRNKLLPSRSTLYVADVPEIAKEVEFIAEWAVPVSDTAKVLTRVDARAVVEYVSAFYHGLDVKLLPPSTFRLSAWEDRPRYLTQLKNGRTKSAQTVGIEAAGQKIGVRVRPSPDDVFPRQLNLNDLIEAIIEALPSDAYAMVLLTDHDLYEDDEDVFVCGRAYGGSRVAVISTARYNPKLDDFLELETSHAWPNSHCAKYISTMVSAAGAPTANSSGSRTNQVEPSSPIGSAIHAVAAYRNSRVETEVNAWLGRVCRTVSHELGHCFGIGHCVYYACCMQGSATLHEDIRQPPYLCPVDLAKVLRATGSTVNEHYAAMIDFCRRYDGVELFAAYAAWLETIITTLQQ